MGIFDFFRKSNQGKTESPSQKNDDAESRGKSTYAISSAAKSNGDVDGFFEENVVPVEKRIKGVNPSCDGLYPHEVLVLSYASSFHIEADEFQWFWWKIYGIENVRVILKSLENRGYIEPGTIADAIREKTLPVIKDELKKRDLKVTGKKDELVRRLIENVPESELMTVFSNRPYIQTDKGRDVLAEYEEISFIHSHGVEGLNIWNITDIVHHDPMHRKCCDIVLDYMDRRSIRQAQEKDYGFYRNSRLNMSDLLAEEERWEESFNLLCEVCDYDLSGMGNSFDMGLINVTSRFYFPYEHTILILAPGVLNRISMCQKKLGWNDGTLRTKLTEQLAKVSLPFRVFTNEECLKIILTNMGKDSANLKQIYWVAETRFKKTYRTK